MKKIFLRNIITILILIIAVSGAILPKGLDNLDEIWNYNFARNFADGLLPYRDFNMVQTPLFAIICGIILKLTFNELIIMRILAIILITAILYVSYKIMEILKIHQYIINILIIGIYLLFYKYFSIDYNYIILLIILISIYIELKNQKEILVIRKYDIPLGILIGTSILFKQTIGIFLSLSYIFYKVLLIAKKEDCKKTLKIISRRLFGVLIPIILFGFFLSINNIWSEFLDYTLYSLKTFTNRISYLRLVRGNYGIAFSILSILLPFSIFAMYFIAIYNTIKTEQQKNIFILFVYSVPSLVVLYPISDGIHFIIGALPSLISLFYIIYLILKRMIKNNTIIIYGLKYFAYSFSIITIIVFLVYSIINITHYIQNCTKYQELEHFNYIPASSSNIKEVDNFILEQNMLNKDVYILDATASIYMIPINKYNKDYDMFLKGNLGSKGEEGQIEKLKKEDNDAIVLIMSEKYKRNWQNPEKVREYIINNWIKIGTISNFDIYENK